MPQFDAESQHGGQKFSTPLLASHTDVDQEAANTSQWMQSFALLAIDVVVGIPFWYVVNYWLGLPNIPYYCILVGILILAGLWRALQPRLCGRVNERLPYPIGYFVDEDGRELFLVATVHISPRSSLDATAVIKDVNPDVVMIELDEERLDIMRPKKQEPPKMDDLQPLILSGVDVEDAVGPDTSISAQRAIWNAEKRGDKIKARLAHDVNDPHGLAPSSDIVREKLILVLRGPKDIGKSATFLVKAHRAAKQGAVGVVVVDDNDELPAQRLGVMSGHILEEVKLAFHTRSFSFPPIPLVMVTASAGRTLIDAAMKPNSTAQLELQVMDDHYPRRTLKRGLCQACMLYASGVGILYGIVRCFQVDVGGEFMAAEEAASNQGVPCVCIDFDMNRLWSRILKVTKPTPSNILRIVWSWLACGRVVFRMLFPPPENVDNLGSMVLHAKSFPLRNWMAFVIAGFGASLVSQTMLNAVSVGATDAAVSVHAVSKSSSDNFQLLLLNVACLYLLPCVYEGILASRDEAMYRGICSKARSLGAKRMVAVTGAAHTNGILQRCRERGLA